MTNNNKTRLNDNIFVLKETGFFSKLCFSWLKPFFDDNNKYKIIINEYFNLEKSLLRYFKLDQKFSKKKLLQTFYYVRVKLFIDAMILFIGELLFVFGFSIVTKTFILNNNETYLIILGLIILKLF